MPNGIHALRKNATKKDSKKSVKHSKDFWLLLVTKVTNDIKTFG